MKSFPEHKVQYLCIVMVLKSGNFYFAGTGTMMRPMWRPPRRIIVFTAIEQ